MVRTRAIQVRLTRAQYEQITQNAARRGFASLSSFLRYVALAQEARLDQKLTEIHQHLLGTPPTKTYKHA